MSARHSKWIVSSALALAATSVLAGQITLYENTNFQGRYIAANDGIAIVARPGFGDSALSIVVSDGIWEACTDAYFRGNCAQLLPGNYPRIDVSLNGRIASVRQVGYIDRATPVAISPQPGIVNPAAVALSPPPQIIVVNPAPVVTSVQPVVVNPAPIATSVQPVVVNPAPIATSVQPVVVNPAPVLVTPPPSVTAGVQPTLVTQAPVVPAVLPSTGRAVLYEYPNFGGAKVALDRGQAKDLEWAHFDNPVHRATSIRVESGTWLFCSEPGFQGACRVLGPGEYPQLSVAGISSAQQVWRPEYGALSVYSR